jgi:hypothetical protein
MAHLESPVCERLQSPPAGFYTKTDHSVGNGKRQHAHFFFSSAACIVQENLQDFVGKLPNASCLDHGDWQLNGLRSAGREYLPKMVTALAAQHENPFLWWTH